MALTRGTKSVLTGTAVMCLACIAAASAAAVLAAGGLVQEAHAQQASLTVVPAGHLRDDGSRLLAGAKGVDIFTIDGSTYAAVASLEDGGLQIVDVTNPDSPVAAGQLADDDSRLLSEASDVDIFTISGSTYAAVTSEGEGGLQIVDITNPASPTAAGNLPDTSGANNLLLSNTIAVDTFEIDGSTYAAVVTSLLGDQGLQIVDVTNPDSPVAAGQLANNDSWLLAFPRGVDTFEIGGSTYAAVTARGEGLQIVDVTNPARPVAAGQLADNPVSRMINLHGVDTFEIGGSTYAAVTSELHHGLHLVDITDPTSPMAAGSLLDGGSLRLNHPRGVDTFVVGTSTYAAVASFGDNGLQIVDITNPSNPTAARNLGLGNNYVATFMMGSSVYAAVTSSAGVLHMVQLAAVDVTGPSLASATLDEGTGAMTITFDEVVDVSETDLSKMYISDAGQANTVQLTGAAFDSAAADSETISLTLSQEQLNLIIPMGTPQLDIAAGAVADPLTNAIGDSPDGTIDRANLPPVAPDAHAVTEQGMPVAVRPAISDPDGPTATISAVADPSNGSVTFDGTSITYTPGRGFEGIVSFGYTVTDGNDDAHGTVTVSVSVALDNPVSVGYLPDDGSLLLKTPRGVDTFTIDGSTYAAVTSRGNNGLQIVDITNPASPTAIGQLRDNGSILLNKASDVDTFTIDGSTYAAVTSRGNNGLQIVDITNPDSPVAAGQLADDDSRLLKEANGVDIFTIGTRTYAAVTSDADKGLQIVDITDPASPAAAGNLPDTDGTDGSLLNQAWDVDTFTIDGSTYAAVTSVVVENGLQIVDITDPDNPTATGQLADSVSLQLSVPQGVDTFTIDGSTYAAVASRVDGGLQIVDVTDPDNPAAAGQLADSNDPLLLSETNSVHTFAVGGSTYAAVTSRAENRFQIVDITDPATPAAAGSLPRKAWDVDTFVTGNSLYAAVTPEDGGLQIVRLATVDDTRPSFMSATLDEGTGAMTITFDEALDSSETDLSKMYISDAGQANTVQLTGAAFDSAAADSETISLTLSQEQLDLIIPMGTPQLDIAAGAVADPAGNLINASPDNPIAVAGAPQANSPPLAPPATATTAEDAPVTITPAMSDPDAGDTPSISEVADPPNGTATSDGTSIIYTPDQDYEGTDTFGYTVTDGQAKTQGTITVTVARGNNDPVLGAIGDRAATVGVRLDIVPTVTDGDPTDTHTYSINRGTLPAEAVFAPSDGSLTWTPVPADAGNTYAVTITVDDGRDGTDSETFDIAVGAEDTTPPTLEGATLDVADKTLSMTFSEPIDHDRVSLDLIYLEDYALTGSAITSTAGSVLTVTLSDSIAAAIDSQPNQDLAVVNGAIYDVAGNGIEDSSIRTSAPGVPVDDTRPTFESATLDVTAQTLEIAFSEPINHATVNLAGIYIGDPDGQHHYHLATPSSVDGKPGGTVASTTGSVLTVTLHPGLANLMGTLPSPLMDMVSNSVYDDAGNGNPTTSRQPVTLTNIPPGTTMSPPGSDATAEQSRIEKLQRQIDKRQDHIDRLEAKIDAARLTADQWKIPGWQDKIEDIEERIAELEARLNADYYAGHLQAKIDKLQERIASFEAKIDRLDPATDQTKIDKIQAKIDRLQNRITELEAKIAGLEPEPDTTPPSFVSGTLDRGTGVLTLEFDETVDVSETKLNRMFLNDSRLSSHGTIDENAPDSATVTITIDQQLLSSLTGPAEIDFRGNAVSDIVGNTIVQSNGNPVAIQ